MMYISYRYRCSNTHTHLTRVHINRDSVAKYILCDYTNRLERAYTYALHIDIHIYIGREEARAGQLTGIHTYIHDIHQKKESLTGVFI